MNRTALIARLTTATSVAALFALGAITAEPGAANAQSGADTATASAASVPVDGNIKVNADGLDFDGNGDLGGQPYAPRRNGITLPSGPRPRSNGISRDVVRRNPVIRDVIIVPQQ